MRSQPAARLALAIGASILLLAGQLSAAAPVLGVNGPDLSISKTANTSPIVVGSPWSYTITVRNVGTAPVPGPIRVTDDLGSVLTYVSASGSGWACSLSGGVVTCTTPGSLAAGASLPAITLTVKLGPVLMVPAQVANCASVSGSGSATGAAQDVDPTNNRSCARTPLAQTTATGTLCVAKFNDLDGDGTQDVGDPSMSGWTFKVTDPGGGTFTVATTEATRICKDVAAGTYTVTEVAQPGWTQTAPVPVGPQTVTIVSGQATTLIFGNTKGDTTLGTYCVVKFNDLDGDGVRDANEPGLPGWVFTVKDVPDLGGGAILTTGADGTYCAHTPPGLHTVTETLQAGWTATTPGGITQSLTVVGGQTVTVTFGNVKEVAKTGTLCIVKFNDLNGNGTKDAGEPTIGNWPFKVTDANAQSVTLTTPGDGKVCHDFPAGTYTVTEFVQQGWTQTTPTPIGPVTVGFGAGETKTLVFGNTKGICCLTLVFLAGTKDNFSLADGASAEPVVPAPSPPTSQLTFDGKTPGKSFTHRFTLPAGSCIESATYEIRMKPLRGKGSDPKNDTIQLRVPGGVTWLPKIDDLSLDQAPAYHWAVGKPAKTFVWNLASTPINMANLLPGLDTNRILDTWVQSDTSVDYIQLTVTFCACEKPSPGTFTP
jgi:uncharacterized repeat protein (TIGR01451 family)